jgi:hypothetical protein
LHNSRILIPLLLWRVKQLTNEKESTGPKKQFKTDDIWPVMDLSTSRPHFGLDWYYDRNRQAMKIFVDRFDHEHNVRTGDTSWIV